MLASELVGGTVEICDDRARQLRPGRTPQRQARDGDESEAAFACHGLRLAGGADDLP